MLSHFEASLQERVNDLDKQREGLENMRKILQDQLNTNNQFFVEERTRLKEKQQFMDELKQKYEEVISNQKQQLLSEQTKIKKLEDELHFKSVELKRKSEQQENHIQREIGDLEQQKQEIAR
jgi:chromosome segregation ATPase